MCDTYSVTVKIPSLELKYVVEVSMDYSLFMNLENIKLQLSSKPGVNWDTQVLVYDGCIVRDTPEWHHRRITSSDSLQLHDKKISLTINLPNSQAQRKKSFTVVVEPITTVRELKAIIMAMKGISCDQQQLKFKEKVLQDYEVLTMCGVLSGSKIDVEVGKTVKVEVTRWTTTLFMPQPYTVADVVEMVQSKRLRVRAPSGKQLQPQESVVDQIKEDDYAIEVEVESD